MRLHEIDDRLYAGVREVVDVTHDQVTLHRHLRLPERVAYRRESLAATGPELGPDVLVLALAGPNPPLHAEPHQLVPVLRRLRPGSRLLLLGGWPVDALPVNRLLDPLGTAGCQVVAAAPLDRVAIRGVHLALLVERVEAPVPPRPYLLGAVPGAEPAPEDSPRALLRVANEHILGDLVARPLRRRLAELTERIEALERDLAERDGRVAEAQRALAEAQERLAGSESSPAPAGRVRAGSGRRPRLHLRVPGLPWRRRRS